MDFLKGKVLYQIEHHRNYILEEEDTLYYPNYVGHRWENPFDEDAKILIVTTQPYKF